MMKGGREVCTMWGEYAMMKAGLIPSELSVREYALFMQCYGAEAELNAMESRKARK